MLLFINISFNQEEGGVFLLQIHTQSVTDTSESTSTAEKSCFCIGIAPGAICGSAACDWFDMHSVTYREKSKYL